MSMFSGLGRLVGQGPNFDEQERLLPLLRLTVLGAADVGKTSLITSWVNNTCPSAYLPTDEATLYYRTMRVQNPVAQEDDKDQLINVLLEIEDTYAWGRSQGKDVYGKPYDAKQFVDVTPLRNPAKLQLPGSKPKMAMAAFPGPSRTTYSPMARARMGFLIVFDANRRESLDVAKEIHFDLSRQNLNKHKIVLVATKIDKDPFNPALKEVLTEARNYAKNKAIQVAEVSAVDFTRVRKLFRDVAEKIIERPHLWSEDGQGLPVPSKSGMATMADATEECSVQ